MTDQPQSPILEELRKLSTDPAAEAQRIEKDRVFRASFPRERNRK